MIYILEFNLAKKKLICSVLKLIYELRKTKTFFLLKMLGFLNNLKISDLTKEQIKKFMKLIESLEFQLASNLKNNKNNNVFFKEKFKYTSGILFVQGIPLFLVQIL